MPVEIVRPRSHQKGTWLVALALSFACMEDGGASGATVLKAKSPKSLGKTATATELAAPEPWVRRRTTSPKIALRNLDSQIAAGKRRYEAGQTRLAERRRLVALLLVRLRFTGSFEDFALSDAVSASALAEFPKKPGAHLLRASYLSGVHQFELALKALDRAQELGAKSVALQRAWIKLALGRDLQALLASAQLRASRKSTPGGWSLVAAIEGSLGLFEQADAHYQKALDINVDVSPFLICQILFQRAVMWAEQADEPARAMPLYREAVKRLPHYVGAQVHLAELEAEAGDLKAAIVRLRTVASQTHDPEPAGVLSQLLREAGSSGGPALQQSARQGYEALLLKHRAGFLDHASEFFGGPGGNARLSLKLAEENLVLRDTARSRRLVLQAAFAAGNSARLCAVAASSTKWAQRSPRLTAALAQYASKCANAPKPKGSEANLHRR